jgi:excisionase family DNA binding protein
MAAPPNELWVELSRVLAEAAQLPADQLPDAIGLLEAATVRMWVVLMAPTTDGARAREQPATAPPSEQGQLTQEEAAKAYKMPLRTVRRLTRTRRVPSVPVGRNRMIRPADMDDYLARCRAQGVKVGAGLTCLSPLRDSTTPEG